MNDMFQENLKKLTKKYSQKFIADKTGFSQSSINNYISKKSEPSIQFLIALKDAFGISVDDFLFTNFEFEEKLSFDRYIGNYIIYYYNNDSYKGEVHTNLKNTLKYGILSIYKKRDFDKNVRVIATFMKDRASAIEILKGLKNSEDVENSYPENEKLYTGAISVTDQSIFINLVNKDNGDQTSFAFHNPPSKLEYLGGVGTVNSIARGREHNPCIQFVIMSKKIIDVPDGEIYNLLKLDDYSVNMEDNIKDIIDLFKRLYVEKNEISLELTDNQKAAVIRNKLEYHFEELLEANLFRFAKVSNKEDDDIFKLIREGIDV